MVGLASGCTAYVEPSGGAKIVPQFNQAGVYHRVERGQTLWRIAKVYGVPLQSIVDANHLADAGRLEIGQQIFVPGSSEAMKVRATSGSARQRRVVIAKGEDFIWPVRGRLISRFGAPTHDGRNRGINIAARIGTPVKAARSGVVAFSKENLRGFGKTVIIDHGENFSTVYAYLDSIAVVSGQVIQQHEVIGTVGNTGRASHAALHFEIRRRHESKNPHFYLP